MPASERYFRPGQVLFKEGDPSSSMFLLKKGSVAIRKRKGEAFIELARVYSNEVIGELSFFDRQPRSATAVALTEVECLELDFDSLDEVYVKVPEYLKTIMRAVAERLRKANDTIRRLQKQVVSEKGKGGQQSASNINTADIIAATKDFGVKVEGLAPEDDNESQSDDEEAEN